MPDTIEHNRHSPRDSTGGDNLFRLHLLDIVSSIAASFAGTSALMTDEALRSALGALGRFADVDRSYVFRLSPDATTWTSICEWCAPDIEPSIPAGESVPVKAFPWAFRRLQEGPVLHFADVDSLPDEAYIEAERWRRQGLRSTLVVSLFIDERLAGIMGFDTLKEPKMWSGEDVALLRTVADVFVQAWQRQEMQRALEKAKERAETMNRLKTEFLANVSHEVRTPLNHMLGMADLLADADSDAERREYIGVIRTAGDTLVRMFEDILDLSLIESGGLAIELEACDLRAIIADLVAGFATETDDGESRLAVSIAGNVPREAVTDPDRLGQILRNLIDNALRFSDDDPVDITLEMRLDGAAGPRLLFRVSDRGVGVPPEHRDRIFERFTQVDESHTRARDGLGIGLPICRHLVHLLGGEIGHEDNVGSGSVFWFTLPLRDAVDRKIRLD